MKCLNGGECVMLNNGLGCKCKTGFTGARCEIDVSQQPACKDVQLLNQPWRSVNNSRIEIGNCDSSRFQTGWWRFDGPAGNKILESKCVNGLNKCGGKYPGYIIGDHPGPNQMQATGELKFFSSYCNSDRAEVDIFNCGSFYSYKFKLMPWYSCDFVICTGH